VITRTRRRSSAALIGRDVSDISLAGHGDGEDASAARAPP
jgi:hypothetical protein